MPQVRHHGRARRHDSVTMSIAKTIWSHKTPAFARSFVKPIHIASDGTSGLFMTLSIYVDDVP